MTDRKYTIKDIERIHQLMGSSIKYYNNNDLEVEKLKRFLTMYCLDMIEWMFDFEDERK